MTREVIDGNIIETVSVPVDSHDDVVTVTVTPADEVVVPESVITNPEPIVSDETEPQKDLSVEGDTPTIVS